MSFGGGASRPAVKNTGKMGKSSVRVLFAAKPWFALGFSHIWPIALEFCSAHATRCMATAALYFASRTENRVVFQVALGRQNTGVLNVPVPPQSVLIEGVGFELVTHLRRGYQRSIRQGKAYDS